MNKDLWGGLFNVYVPNGLWTLQHRDVSFFIPLTFLAPSMKLAYRKATVRHHK